MDAFHKVVFRWPSTDVSDVIVTGTFDQWSKSTHLNRTPTGFEGIVDIPWGQRVQYKFLVDWQWRVLDGHPTEYDAVGNLNNVYVAPPKPIDDVSTPKEGRAEEAVENGSAPEAKPSNGVAVNGNAHPEPTQKVDDATNGDANGDIAKSEPPVPPPADVTPTVPVKVDLPPAVPIVDEKVDEAPVEPVVVEEPTIAKPETNGHVNGVIVADAAPLNGIKSEEKEEKKEEVVDQVQEPLSTPKTSPTSLPEVVEPSTPKPSSPVDLPASSPPSSPAPASTTSPTSSPTPPPAAAPTTLPPAPTSPPPSAPATPSKSPAAPTTPSKKHQRFPSMAGSTSGRSSVDSSPASSRFSTATGEKDGSPRKKKGSIFKRLSSIFHHHHKDKEEKVEGNGKHH